LHEATLIEEHPDIKRRASKAIPPEGASWDQEAIPPEGASWDQEAIPPEGASWDQEAIPPEATQPVRCILWSRQVRLGSSSASTNIKTAVSVCSDRLVHTCRQFKIARTHKKTCLGHKNPQLPPSVNSSHSIELVSIVSNVQFSHGLSKSSSRLKL
jgi:hypothetical protein